MGLAAERAANSCNEKSWPQILEKTRVNGTEIREQEAGMGAS
jgi:hypothetical protein